MTLQIISLFLNIVKQYQIFNDSASKLDNLSESFEEFSTSNLSKTDTQQNENTIFNSQDKAIKQKFKKKHQSFLNTSLKFQQKQNIIKNIIKSFSKYLKNLSNEKAIQRFTSVLGTDKSFSNIKKNFLKAMKKKNNRWNHILKGLIYNENLSKIFKCYLEKESIYWLNFSKADNLYDHQIMINLIKEALSSEEQVQIVTYKKK
ncbi:hypothetical protein ABPG74_000610 [Tetrahymena malaccensis]